MEYIEKEFVLQKIEEIRTRMLYEVDSDIEPILERFYDRLKKEIQKMEVYSAEEITEEMTAEFIHI